METFKKITTGIYFIYKHAQVIFGGAYVSALLINPQWTFQNTYNVLHANDGFILKVLAGYSITYVFVKTRHVVQSAIISSIYQITHTLFNERHNEILEESQLIDDIPKTELVDYLLVNKNLNIKHATEYFLVPQNKIEKLAKKLEEVEILVRGDNNARILNIAFSRSDIANILQDANTIDSIAPLFRKKENGYTSVPSNLPTVQFVHRSIS